MGGGRGALARDVDDEGRGFRGVEAFAPDQVEAAGMPRCLPPGLQQGPGHTGGYRGCQAVAPDAGRRRLGVDTGLVVNPYVRRGLHAERLNAHWAIDFVGQHDTSAGRAEIRNVSALHHRILIVQRRPRKVKLIGSVRLLTGIGAAVIASASIAAATSAARILVRPRRTGITRGLGTIRITWLPGRPRRPRSPRVPGDQRTSHGTPRVPRPLGPRSRGPAGSNPHDAVDAA